MIYHFCSTFSKVKDCPNHEGKVWKSASHAAASFCGYTGLLRCEIPNEHVYLFNGHVKIQRAKQAEAEYKKKQVIEQEHSMKNFALEEFESKGIAFTHTYLLINVGRNRGYFK